MACTFTCPANAISVQDNLPEIDYEKCFGCWNCVNTCNEREDIKRVPEIEKYLPGLDCRNCGRDSCEDFSVTVKAEADLLGCPELGPELIRAMNIFINPDNYLPPVPITANLIPSKTGVFEFGEPGFFSPVIVTGNYIHTINRLMSALDFWAGDAFILVMDTQGYSLRIAVTLGLIDSTTIIEDFSLLKDRIKHSQVILPRQFEIIKIPTKSIKPVYPCSTIEELPSFLVKNGQFLESLRRMG